MKQKLILNQSSISRSVNLIWQKEKGGIWGGGGEVLMLALEVVKNIWGIWDIDQPKQV